MLGRKRRNMNNLKKVGHLLMMCTVLNCGTTIYLISFTINALAENLYSTWIVMTKIVVK